MKRLAFAAAAVAVIAYCVDNVREVIRQYEQQQDTARIVQHVRHNPDFVIRHTAPGWQR
jgi:hypothetical protein